MGIRQTNWIMMSLEFDDPKVCDQGQTGGGGG